MILNMKNETQNNSFITDGVDEWNTKLAKLLIPNDVILSLYVLAGIFGNGVVIFIYGFRMKGKKDDRFFIPFLAIVDLSASSVCASFGIALNMMQAKFDNTYLCKTWWFFSAFTTLMSIQMLLIIAVHRYRKICKPLGLQMTTKWKRIAMAIAGCIAVTIAGPTIHFYGSVPFPNEDGTIIGRRCSKIKGGDKTGSIIFGGVFGLLAITVVTSLIAVYTIVGYTIYRHFKSHKLWESKSDLNGKSVSKGPEKISYSTNESTITTNTVSSRLDDESTDDMHPNARTKNVKNIIVETKIPNPKCTHPKPSSHDKTSKRVMIRFTLMFMLITIVFLVCYIPKVILLIIESRNPKFWEQFTDSERAGVLFVYRMYIINNVANPIIYGFMDIQFREELRKLFICRRN